MHERLILLLQRLILENNVMDIFDVSCLFILIIYLQMSATKSEYCFQVQGNSVKFSSNFDSGNLRTVKQQGPKQFLVEAAYDSYQFPTSNKSFFHYSVQNYPIGEQLIIKVTNLALLSCIKREKMHLYRPCYSYNSIDYVRLEKKNVQILQSQQNFSLKIKMIIEKPVVFFAFGLPYSYQRYLNMVRDLPESNQQFYLKKQVLCYSKNLNLVYMITITSYDRKTEEIDQIGSVSNGVILPEKHLNEKRIYFDKPVILLSARVHPGQTPSSWAIEGIIKFLISNDQNAILLRKHFLIVIVPMLNPDGVYQGMYRLDTLGHNLNRYYLISDNRQPSIYAMKHLIKHYHASKRLLYFFDFHGHPSFKGSFMYGNAIDDVAYQAQTQLFGCLMGLTCESFEQKYCIFDRQQMSSKDKHDMYTKQGCARVYAFKMSNILHSYTIQMGFHASNYSGIDVCNKSVPQDFLYDEQTYYKEGVSVLLCILQSSGLKNDYDRFNLRKKIAAEIVSREQRFRKQDKNYHIKKKNVNQIIENQYWKPIRQKYFSIKLSSNSPTRKYIRDKSKKKRGHSIRDIFMVSGNIQKLQQQRTQIQQTSLTLQTIENKNQVRYKSNFSRKIDQIHKNGNQSYMKFQIKSRMSKTVYNKKHPQFVENNKKKCVIDKLLPLPSNRKAKKQILIPQKNTKEVNTGTKITSFHKSFYQSPKSEQFMFNDVKLRNQSSLLELDQIKDASKQVKPILSNMSMKNKMPSEFNEFKQIFQTQNIKNYQMSKRKLVKAQVQYFKFFQP